MKIKEKLQAIVTYLEATRKVGHTTALLQGLNNTPEALFLIFNLNTQKDFPTIKSHRFVSLNSLKRLIGQNAPLVIDNAALWVLLSEARDRIEELENQLVWEQNKQPVQMSPQYENEIIEARKWFRDRLKDLPPLQVTEEEHQKGVDALPSPYLELTKEAFNIWIVQREYEMSYSQMCQAFFGAAAEIHRLTIAF